MVWVSVAFTSFAVVLFRHPRARRELAQVLMNLVMNARDALNRRVPSRTDDREILIRVRSVPGDGAGLATFKIIDNGDGFDRATAERVFDPFFTPSRTAKQSGSGSRSATASSRRTGWPQLHELTRLADAVPGRAAVHAPSHLGTAARATCACNGSTTGTP